MKRLKRPYSTEHGVNVVAEMKGCTLTLKHTGDGDVVMWQHLHDLHDEIDRFRQMAISWALLWLGTVALLFATVSGWI